MTNVLPKPFRDHGRLLAERPIAGDGLGPARNGKRPARSVTDNLA
jgi:hypothetical protein